MKYPMTPSQIATAERRGWTAERKGGNKTGKYIAPKNFTAEDQRRIDEAQVRRERRAVGAD